jgi:putative FmdB family regulatory protein
MDSPDFGKRERSIQDVGKTMPIYEYECNSCGHSFERIMKVGEAEPACPTCGAPEARKRVVPFRTNAWSTFLDGMEKRVNPHKFK